MLVLPTGAGKTLCFCKILHSVHVNKKKAVLVVHGVELVQNASQRLFLEDVPHGVIQGNHFNNRPDENIQVCSITTLYRRKKAPDADILIIDEAHMATSKSYKWLADQYQNAFFMPVTATPNVKKGLRHISDDYVAPIGINGLIEEGFLCPPRYFSPSKIDVSGVKIDSKTGDYVTSQLEEVMDDVSVYGDLVENYKRKGENRKALIFAVTVEHSKKIKSHFNNAGITCEHIDAKTPRSEREEVFRKLEAGEIQAITNVGVLTVGVDIPCLGALIFARPTMSYNLWIQMCLDLQTEVLTKDGFKNYKDIHQCKEIAVFDTDTSEIRWETYNDYIYRDMYDFETMISYKSPHLDFRVTSEHDLLIRTGRNPKNSDWKKETANYCFKRRSAFQVPSSGYSKFKGVDLINYQLMFIGLWVADGTHDKSNNRLSICQSKHQKWNKSIRIILTNCGLNWSEKEVSGGTSFNETSPRIHYRIKRDSKYLDDVEKFLDKDFSELLHDCTPEQFESFLYGLNLGDGRKFEKAEYNPRSLHISTGNKKLADNVQMACILRGYQCNIYKHDYNLKPLYDLHIKKRVYRSIGGRYYKDGRPQLKEEFVQEKVWCLSTKTGTLITRRNGKVMVMGNCGRGTRLYPGKKDFLVFDHVGNLATHGFIEDEREVLLDGWKNEDFGTAIINCEKCFLVFDYRENYKKTLKEDFDEDEERLIEYYNELIPDLKRGDRAFKTKLLYICPDIECEHDNTPPADPIIKKTGQTDDVLRELSEKERLDIRVKTRLKELKNIRKSKGYKNGWVYFTLKAEYGEELASKFVKKRVVPDWVKKKITS